MIKKLFLLTIFLTLSACATTQKPIVPELEGKQRIKINDQVQTSEGPEPTKEAAPIPAAKDTKGSSKNVRKKGKAGNT